MYLLKYFMTNQNLFMLIHHHLREISSYLTLIIFNFTYFHVKYFGYFNYEVIDHFFKEHLSLTLKII